MAVGDKNTSRRIVIVGGGVSGLSIALRLGQSGLAVTLLEAASLGQSASTRNQGWLYSGAWFAATQPVLARACHQSLQQTIRFCPDCVEPATLPMIYIISSPAATTSRWGPAHWTNAWKSAEIPYEQMPVNAAIDELGDIDESLVQHAFRLPDRAIRIEILLERLAAAARNAGVEIRTGTPVTEVLKAENKVHGVRTARGEEIAARLVVLAANAGGMDLWPRNESAAAGRQTEFTRVALKTHCLAIHPEVAHTPFCVVDMEGFNHLPHRPVSVFGSQRWLSVPVGADTKVMPSEVERLWTYVDRCYPRFCRDGNNVVEWAGITVQAMHVDQVEPGLSPMPTVIDHDHEPPRLSNIVSVFPGRATLWPHLAEATRRVVLEKLGNGIPETARPRWAIDALKQRSSRIAAQTGNGV